MSEEEWRVIFDFPDYAVSNLGRIKRLTSVSKAPEIGRLAISQACGTCALKVAA